MKYMTVMTLATACCLSAGCGHPRSSSLADAFNTVSVGDDQAAVQLKMGEPNSRASVQFVSLQAEQLVWKDGRASYTVILGGIGGSERVIGKINVADNE